MTNIDELITLNILKSLLKEKDSPSKTRKEILRDVISYCGLKKMTGGELGSLQIKTFNRLNSLINDGYVSRQGGRQVFYWVNYPIAQDLRFCLEHYDRVQRGIERAKKREETDG